MNSKIFQETGNIPYNSITVVEMENIRRKLRKDNTCNQIGNIFHYKQGPLDLLSQLPTNVLKKIGNFQKISCEAIIQLSQFTLSRPISEEVEKCKLASQFQQLWEHELRETYTPESEKPTVSAEIKLQGEELATPSQLLGRKGKKQTQEEMMMEEPSLPRRQIWRDSSFLQNLNQFLILGENNSRSRVIGQDFFQK